MATWILLCFLPILSSGMDPPRLQLESRVFVAFAGEDLSITADLHKPANQTRDVLTCADPSDRELFICDILATDASPQTEKVLLELKNLSLSGEYSCRYKAATERWFLRVRAEGYRDVVIFDYTEFISVAVVTVVLLVFSVVGSVFVFRGHKKVTKCGSAAAEKPPPSPEEKKQNETDGENLEVAAQSSSFYASLEPRPRSIYDVLDRPAPKDQPDQKTKAKKKKKRAEQPDPERQDDGAGDCDCVYENF